MRTLTLTSHDRKAYGPPATSVTCTEGGRGPRTMDEMPGRLRFVAVLCAFTALATAAPSYAKPAKKPAAPLPGVAVDRVRFEPLDPASALSVQGVGDYRGVVDVVRGGAGVAVVNELSMEDYLLGITEVPASWPAEAQKAQAIAARTYAHYEIQNKVVTEARAIGANLCATDSCQVYTGLAKDRLEGSANWAAAVRATAGQVLVYQGKPILAKYSSSNGGRTVAGGKPYLRAVNDPDDAASPLNRWQSVIPLGALQGLFALPGPVADARRVGDTVVIAWRAEQAEGAENAEGGNVVEHQVGAVDFRAIVNGALPAPAGLPLALPSVRYDLGSDGFNAIAAGRGWGHGIGMSQWGALRKAQRGMTAADILAAYYAGLRPLAPPAGSLPTKIRVLVGSQSAATVTATGRFRVLDAKGQPLAVIADGAWQVLPGRGREVRVIAPRVHAQPPTVEPLGIEPAVPRPGTPARLKFRLSAPAAVRVTVQPPGGVPALATEPAIQEAGVHEVAIPASAVAGDGIVTIAAEAGVGRATTLPIGFTVAMPDAPKPQPRPAFGTSLASSYLPGDVGGDAPAWLQTLAAVLLATVVVAAARVRRAGRLSAVTQ